MNVYMLRTSRSHTFYAESGAPDTQRAAPGWWERKWTVWRDRLNKAEGHTARFVKRIEAWLRRFERPDEPMMRSLRHTDGLTVFHPSIINERLAIRAWRHYLSGQGRRHLGWLTINLILSPLSVLLTPIPGPNVIGYWFVYRVICHALALAGIHRARSRKCPTHYTPEPALDAVIDQGTGATERLSTHFGWTELTTFLHRNGNGAQPPRTAPEHPLGEEAICDC